MLRSTAVALSSPYVLSNHPMRTQDAGIRFPILAFTADQDVWRIETLDILTTCGPRTLKDDMQAGMQIVDAKLDRWAVRSVRRVGRAEAFLPWLVGAVLTATAQSRIEHELEPLAPTGFGEVRARVSAAIEAHPLFWCNDPEEDREEILLALLAAVGAARSVADIH